MGTTLTELLKEDMLFASEDDDFFYIKLTKERMDDTVWKVDKKTEKASYMQYLIYLELEIDHKVILIDPETLKRVS